MERPFGKGPTTLLKGDSYSPWLLTTETNCDDPPSISYKCNYIPYNYGDFTPVTHLFSAIYRGYNLWDDPPSVYPAQPDS